MANDISAFVLVLLFHTMVDRPKPNSLLSVEMKREASNPLQFSSKVLKQLFSLEIQTAESISLLSKLKSFLLKWTTPVLNVLFYVLLLVCV